MYSTGDLYISALVSIVLSISVRAAFSLTILTPRLAVSRESTRPNFAVTYMSDFLIFPSHAP